MANNEVFTPEWYIKKIDKTFDSINGPVIDNCCGGGVWLKYAQDKGYEVWGCDIEPKNCISTIELLYGRGDIVFIDDKAKIPKDMISDGLIGIFTHNGKIVQNVVCADSFKYRMNFNSPAKPETFGNGLFEIV